jgi:hypothetical protein
MESLGLHLSRHCWPSSPEILRSAVEKALVVTAGKQFRYTSLLQEGHIRLLAVDIGSGNDQICTRLVTYPLDVTPDYIALSCTWGDPDDTCRVLCHGQQLSITRNLQAALWRLRDMLSSVRKWFHVNGIDMVLMGRCYMH